jgi:hypothetical protein
MSGFYPFLLDEYNQQMGQVFLLGLVTPKFDGF